MGIRTSWNCALHYYFSRSEEKSDANRPACKMGLDCQQSLSFDTYTLYNQHLRNHVENLKLAAVYSQLSFVNSAPS